MVRSTAVQMVVLGSTKLYMYGRTAVTVLSTAVRQQASAAGEAPIPASHVSHGRHGCE
jgi:hypothetical protein